MYLIDKYFESKAKNVWKVKEKNVDGTYECVNIHTGRMKHNTKLSFLIDKCKDVTEREERRKVEEFNKKKQVQKKDAITILAEIEGEFQDISKQIRTNNKTIELKEKELNEIIAQLRKENYIPDIKPEEPEEKKEEVKEEVKEEKPAVETAPEPTPESVPEPVVERPIKEPVILPSPTKTATPEPKEALTWRERRDKKIQRARTLSRRERR